jgi:dTDP-4-amino-4,6-dideoxygalactose transaminase
MFYLPMRDIDDSGSLIKQMRDFGIITPFYYVPLHSSPGGQRYGWAHGPLTVTNSISDRLVRLPMFFNLGSQAETVIDQALVCFAGERGEVS